jgi:hypothetical protein
MKGELHISAREATACTYLPDDIAQGVVRVFHGKWLPQLAWTTQYDRVKISAAVR